MLLLRTTSDFRNTARNVAFAAGFFDGVHTGHQRVIHAAQAAARARNGEAWAFTFAQHPTTLLTPGRHRKLLTPLDIRLELLAETGLHGCLLLDFNAQLAAMTPEDFVAALTSCHGPVRSFHSGDNWRFGRGGTGTPPRLRELGASLNFDVETVPAALWRDEPVSSTRIRHAILAGHLDEAAHMLGRPYRIRETIVHGRAIGRAIGVPTLNIMPRAEVLPPLGVYAVRVQLDDDAAWHDGVANFGFRPTFADRPDAPVLEVHLLAPPDRDTYGLAVEIAFVTYLREERAFASPAALADQIRVDRKNAETALAE